MVVRQYNEELKYLEKINAHSWRIKIGFQPNMNVEGIFYVNQNLEKLMLEELRNSCRPGTVGGFLPGVKQIANVAALPGIVGRSVGLPDVHSGYGFAIGNMAAFDMANPKSVVSPGGVGFDINCGVRLLRTNLREQDVLPVKTIVKTIEKESKKVDILDILCGLKEDHKEFAANSIKTMWIPVSNVDTECAFSAYSNGSTRAFPPHHPLIPVDYQLTGQPVLIGGTMGTCSYVLTGTEQGMHETFGSTCHGAGRALSRAKSRRNLDYQDVAHKAPSSVEKSGTKQIRFEKYCTS
uniref:3'-phosphate/5'-hydroxy nucleic acid ligase n=1 Tax=Timema genevievae TaxID=629358 RepID=A0A7R9K9B2_TIMGE|nr:unnamed protein product [Timema genevievae]